MPYRCKIHKVYLSETHVSPLFHDAPILEQICQPCLSELRTFHQSRFYNLSWGHRNTNIKNITNEYLSEIRVYPPFHDAPNLELTYHFEQQLQTFHQSQFCNLWDWTNRNKKTNVDRSHLSVTHVCSPSLYGPSLGQTCPAYLSEHQTFHRIHPYNLEDKGWYTK